MVVAKRYLYVKAFEGMPKEENFQVVEEELPELKDGEFLVEAVYLSVDPYMRPYAAALDLGVTMIGSQVAKVIESKSSKFEVGQYVVGGFGWRSHTIVSEDDKGNLGWDYPQLVPYDHNTLPLSLALGVLGMPGNTAYFGFLEVCKPKPGETVVVSGAAGAVGSLVGQIAKLKWCTVIGIAGSEEKGEWLKSLGFDHVINYKTQDLRKALAEAAPNGVDCYFDNVGGETSSIILDYMNDDGRISVCGCISSYNALETPKASVVQIAMINKHLEMRGFLVHQWAGRWKEGILQNVKWIQQGKLKYRETITDGFDNMLKAFVGVLEGENTGKAVVKA